MPAAERVTLAAGPRLPRLLANLAALLLLAGCVQDHAQRPAPGTTDAVLPLAVPGQAATFAGDIPCADCPGQRLTLTLFPDFSFRLRQVYLGAGADGADGVFHDLGRWSFDPASGGGLRLEGGTEAPRRFRFIDADQLRMLDNQGREIRSALNYTLSRQAGIDPVAGPMPVTGRYRYMADAAVLEECLTGQRYPVLLAGDHLAAERAYLALRHEPGSEELMRAEVRFVERAPEPGLALRTHLLITRFDRFLPGQGCAAEPGQ